MLKQGEKDATVAAVLKRNHTNTHGEHPVRIRVNFNKVKKFYPIRYDNGKAVYLTDADWDRLWAKDVRKELKQLKERIQKVETAAKAAKETVTKNGPFTFERFENEFLHGRSKKGLFGFFDDYIANLLKEDRIGTYKSCKNAYHAFKAYRDDKDLDPVDLTPEVLKGFELYMLKPRIVPNRKKPLKAGKNTVAMYMRALKAIYNVAADTNPFLKEVYPFAKKRNERGKYQIKLGPGKKADALPIEDIRAFVATNPLEGTQEWKAKNIWLFSFYCNGMNFRDIALLQYQDIGFDAIRYIRRKTSETESTQERMEVPLSDAIRRIIVSLGNPDKHPTSYVFDILKKGLDAKKQDDLIRQGIKTTNKWLGRLCKMNGLPRITTYTARHTFFNLAYQNDVPLEQLRELAGHSDIRTTEAYVKRFDLAKKRETNERIHAIWKVS